MAARWDKVFIGISTSVVMIFVKLSFAFDREDFVFWPNGTVPFYVNPMHFDKEQSLAILTSLSLFTFKTCLQFRPVMAEPAAGQHVMVFENPRGVRKCVISMEGHAKEEPHRITLGYECLRSPHIELAIMKALGFPFEHNRAMRDAFIDVQFENIEPGFIPLFTKEMILPQELRSLPYDINSVMHFSERDYSKNGHRTFIFKNKQTQQSRVGMSKTDYRKIQIVYGPECQKRDRQAKIDTCKKYPSIRRKRDVSPDLDIVQNLRINRAITPPPDKDLADEITDDVKQLNIDKEIENLIELVHKITAKALDTERVKICNNTNSNTTKSENDNSNKPINQMLSTDKSVGSNTITKIIGLVLNHVKEVVTSSKANLTVFCDTTNSIELFQRAKCGWGTEDRCPQKYKPTKSGPIRYSTKHKPVIKQFTKHDGSGKRIPYDKLFRTGNARQYTDNATITESYTEVINVTDSNKADKKAKNNFTIAANASVSRTKRDTELLNIPELTRVTSDLLKVSLDTNNRRKRDTILITNSSNNSFDKNYSLITTEKNIEFKEKRVTEYVTLRDNMSVAEKSHESSLTKAEDLVKNVKESKDTNRNVSTGMLRAVTKIFSDERFHFAPVNRRHRELFGHSDSFDTDNREKRDDSSSLERRKRRRRTTKREVNIRNELDRERDESREGERETPKNRDRKRDREEDRPQRPRGKKRGKPRSHLPETVPLTKANKEFYADRIWPDGIVRYVISEDSTYNLQSMRARLEEVNEILKRNTCVRIEEISEGEGQSYKDYLVIDTSADYVTGRVGGRQVFGSIELFEGGQHRQHAALMVMAMLGFYFELSRHDRDRYVRVHNRHVRPDKLHHFEKIRSDATLNLPYDYASATHPAWQFWRRVGRTGISTVATYKDQDPDGSIMRSLGQNEQLLSNVDIIKINSIYGVHCFKNRRSAVTFGRRVPSQLESV